MPTSRYACEIALRRERASGGTLARSAGASTALTASPRGCQSPIRSMMTTPRSRSSRSRGSRGGPAGGTGSSKKGCGALRRSRSSRCRICSMMNGGSIACSLPPSSGRMPQSSALSRTYLQYECHGLMMSSSQGCGSAPSQFYARLSQTVYGGARLSSKLAMPTRCVKGCGFHRWDTTLSRMHKPTSEPNACASSPVTIETP